MRLILTRGVEHKRAVGTAPCACPVDTDDFVGADLSRPSPIYRPLGLTYAGFAGELLENVRADFVDLTTAQRITSALSVFKLTEEGEDTVNLPTNLRGRG